MPIISEISECKDYVNNINTNWKDIVVKLEKTNPGTIITTNNGRVVKFIHEITMNNGNILGCYIEMRDGQILLYGRGW